MYILIISIIRLTVIATALSLVIYLLNKKTQKDQESLSVFECGFMTLRNRAIPFRIRFYLVAIIFLVFDLEIIIIFPFFLTGVITSSLWNIILITGFTLFLTLGLFHEWNIKLLDWASFAISLKHTTVTRKSEINFL